MVSIDVNEIVVRAEQTPGQVNFHNFEELKEYMAVGLSAYKTTVYTPDNLKQAEKDLKDLKAIKKKIYDKKKELETAYSMPIEEVKKQLDELLAMVKEPMDIIDKMIKENKKEAKRQEIMEYARKQTVPLGEYADKVLESKSFFNERWLNSTYNTKDWKGDIDKIVQDSEDAFKTIQNVGGKNKSALLAFYFDKLSLEGADQFLQVASQDIKEDAMDIEPTDDGNEVIGYKVLKIYGTERQMLQLMTQLDISGMDVEEIEDGMPKDMEEILVPNFDSFVAFDIEHTGTFGIDNGDKESEIIEIGAVKVVNGQIVDKFDMLANPERKIVPRIAKLTHITDDMVRNEPSISEVIKKFKEFIGNSILVGHNIKSCDIPHITRAAKKAGIALDNAYFDTKKLAKKYKEQKNWEKITLEYLSNYFRISQEEAHRAWCDAEANAYVYFELQKLT